MFAAIKVQKFFDEFFNSKESKEQFISYLGLDFSIMDEDEYSFFNNKKNKTVIFSYEDKKMTLSYSLFFIIIRDGIEDFDFNIFDCITNREPDNYESFKFRYNEFENEIFIDFE